MGGIVVIAAMPGEAECLRSLPAGADVTVRVCGVGRAAGAARDACAAGCRGIVSFGIAAGLERSLFPGSVVVGESVVGRDGRRWPADEGWRSNLLGAIGRRGVAGAVANTDILLGPGEKKVLREASGAVAADMESAAIAEAAAAAGISFAAIRAVADPAWRGVPAWLRTAIDGNGDVRPGAALAALARRPWAVPAVAMLALDARQALAALRRVAAVLGRDFGLG